MYAVNKLINFYRPTNRTYPTEEKKRGGRRGNQALEHTDDRKRSPDDQSQ